MRPAVSFTVALFFLTITSEAVAATCRGYTGRLTYAGKLDVGESKVVAEWRTPCEGALNASAAKGRLTLLVNDSGVWREVKQGISTIVPRLPAGTYRLVVGNPYGIRSDYAVSLKYGIG